ncbi:MAG: hypothetical protein COB45_03365 [Gammaproteobacteria bacterium]|jgi:hypothetical protein|nr:MAG: hypothetical protein COB45_03365 [Gammaproteobacteria bacterium]PHR83894.1 MAG: hypothetical protein COA59_09635 [Colwellia sp.]
MSQFITSFCITNASLISHPNYFKMQDSARIKRLIGKALIEKNGYSLFEINSAAYMPFKLAL